MTNSFADRCIKECQPLNFEKSLFARAITEALMKDARLIWDDDRGLFWVTGSGKSQVAVWMMDVAVKVDT